MRCSLKLTAVLFFGLLLCANASPGHAATLTVSPSVISNTYPGVITLTITGLTNTEKVIVQKYFDLNANGAVDAGEPLMSSFQTADNDLTRVIIGGATNINLPFDRDPTGGSITAQLNFAPPLTLENISGNYVFQLVSPTGHFPTVTTTFTVTNATTGQSLSGVIYSNGLVPLTHAIVAAIAQPSSAFAGGAIADNAGHYSLNLNPGTYALIATAPNYYYDQSLAPLVTLTNGMALTNNLSITNGTITISGSVFDAANSNTLAGVTLELQSGNFLTLAFTDTNGNYSAALSPNFWKIRPIKERLPRIGYVCPQGNLQVDATAGNVTNANIPLNKGNALFYGRITDNSSVPFANIEFEADDIANQLSSKGVSDSNGNYAVPVFVGTNVWNSDPSSAVNTALANYILNQFSTTLITNGQAIEQDFTALPVTAHISGQVKDSSGTPVVGVSMFAFTFINPNNYSSLNVQTDNSGNYSLGVASGNWQVNFSIGGNSDLASQGLEDPFQPHLVSIPPTNVTLNITVYPDGTPFLVQPARQSASQFGFVIIGSVGVNYTVLVSTNLASTNWASLFSLQLTNSPFPIVDAHATNSARFYRLQKN